MLRSQFSHGKAGLDEIDVKVSELLEAELYNVKVSKLSKAELDDVDIKVSELLEAVLDNVEVSELLEAELDDVDVEVSELLEAADSPPLHKVEVLVAEPAEEGRVVRYPVFIVNYTV